MAPSGRVIRLISADVEGPQTNPSAMVHTVSRVSLQTEPRLKPDAGRGIALLLARTSHEGWHNGLQVMMFVASELAAAINGCDGFLLTVYRVNEVGWGRDPKPIVTVCQSFN